MYTINKLINSRVYYTIAKIRAQFNIKICSNQNMMQFILQFFFSIRIVVGWFERTSFEYMLEPPTTMLLARTTYLLFIAT